MASPTAPWGNSEEEHLVSRIATGDGDALAALYDRYASLLYSLALQMCGSPQAAEEVIQDVFMSVWRAAGTWTPSKGSLQAWLVAITRNRCLDYLRRNRLPHRQALSLEYELESDGEGPAEVAEARARVNDVRQALSRLSPKYREVIEMIYFHGLSHREAAHALGIPPGTVKSRLRLGLARLAHALRAGGELR